MYILLVYKLYFYKCIFYKYLRNPHGHERALKEEEEEIVFTNTTGPVVLAVAYKATKLGLILAVRS